MSKAQMLCIYSNKNMTIGFCISCFFTIEAKFVQICILWRGVFSPFAARLCVFSRFSRIDCLLQELLVINYVIFNNSFKKCNDSKYTELVTVHLEITSNNQKFSSLKMDFFPQYTRHPFACLVILPLFHPAKMLRFWILIMLLLLRHTNFVWV